VTIPKPKSYYGISKLEAENNIINLQNENFKITILRTPMIYGYKSPGNFTTMRKFSKYLLYFPDTNNKRSIIFIDNLSKYVEYIIKSNSKGYIYPENDEKVSTYKIIKNIRSMDGKITLNCSLIIPFVKLFMIFSKKIKKIFGSLYFDNVEKYQSLDLYNFYESIEMSVNCNE
jgi:UDP-glucose 4-epimerase